MTNDNCYFLCNKLLTTPCKQQLILTNKICNIGQKYFKCIFYIFRNNILTFCIGLYMPKAYWLIWLEELQVIYFQRIIWTINFTNHVNMIYVFVFLFFLKRFSLCLFSWASFRLINNKILLGFIWAINRKKN